MAGEKVLIVDDEPMIIKFLTGFLTREGYEVHSLADGSKLLNTCQRVEPDVMLLDVMLPEKDGFELCNDIRKWSNVPIIFLSAKNETTDKILALTLGADDYLTKPFDSAELLLRIKAVLRRTKEGNKQTGVENEIFIKNLKINLEARTVEKNNKEVKLTQKEFNLLALLAKSPNRVFTRDQLLNDIWETDFADDTGVVTTLVKRLREKVEDNPAKPIYIETVRGIGYRFGGRCH